MKKILFIEDEIITGSIYKHYFTTAGYNVRLAVSDEDSCAALKEFKPDAVVLDLMLPRIKSLEILKHIRTEAATKTVPVIALTNAYARQTIKAAENAGANKCLVKSATSMKALEVAVLQCFASAPLVQPPSGSASVEVSSQLIAGSSLPDPPDPREGFLRSAPPALANLISLCQNLLRTTQPVAQTPIVLELYRAVHALAAQAALAKAPLFAQMASALEALLSELDETPHKLDSSMMRTVNQTVTFLGILFTDAFSRSHDEPPEFKVLAVDDEELSRKCIADALDRAYLNPIVVEDPIVALGLLKKQRFDLVVTDVNMPGMNGFELCAKLHALPLNATTPVIFVTVLDGFKARVRSAQSGGDDFIAKPFLYLELAVRALTLILRPQVKPILPWTSGNTTPSYPLELILRPQVKPILPSFRSFPP